MLVTVTVGSYNSSQYILETLESIYNQTWDDIELIIKDDASTDDSVIICQEWLDKYGKRFKNNQFIISDKNSGPASNFNKGIIAATGEWIKPIAGDDALLPDCIRDNVEHILANKEIKILFSNVKLYREILTEEHLIRIDPGKNPENIISEKYSSQDQYRILLVSDRIPYSPSVFINKKALLDAGLPDERLFPEDYQITLNMTKNGYKLFFMNKNTVKYRQHQGASNNKIQKYIIKPNYFKSEQFRKKLIYPNIPYEIRMSQKYKWIVNQIFRIKYFNKQNSINVTIHYLINVLFNPFVYIIWIVKKIKSNDDSFYKYLR